MNKDYVSFFEQLKNNEPTRNEQDFNIQDEYMQLIEEIAYHGSANCFGKILPKLIYFAGVLAEAKIVDDNFLSQLKEGFRTDQTKAAIEQKKAIAAGKDDRIKEAYAELKKANPQISKESAANKISKMPEIKLERTTIRRKLQSIDN